MAGDEVRTGPEEARRALAGRDHGPGGAREGGREKREHTGGRSRTVVVIDDDELVASQGDVLARDAHRPVDVAPRHAVVDVHAVPVGEARARVPAGAEDEGLGPRRAHERARVVHPVVIGGRGQLALRRGGGVGVRRRHAPPDPQDLGHVLVVGQAGQVGHLPYLLHVVGDGLHAEEEGQAHEQGDDDEHAPEDGRHEHVEGHQECREQQGDPKGQHREQQGEDLEPGRAAEPGGGAGRRGRQVSLGCARPAAGGRAGRPVLGDRDRPEDAVEAEERGVIVPGDGSLQRDGLPRELGVGQLVPGGAKCRMEGEELVYVCVVVVVVVVVGGAFRAWPSNIPSRSGWQGGRPLTQRQCRSPRRRRGSWRGWGG